MLKTVHATKHSPHSPFFLYKLLFQRHPHSYPQFNFYRCLSPFYACSQVRIYILLFTLHSFVRLMSMKLKNIIFSKLPNKKVLLSNINYNSFAVTMTYTSQFPSNHLYNIGFCTWWGKCKLSSVCMENVSCVHYFLHCLFYTKL